jgi:large subunit ribosomal protein L7A
VDSAVLKDFRRRVVGRRETVREIERGRAIAVYVAKDADDAMQAAIAVALRGRNVPVHYINSMRELGQMCGIEVGAACAAEVRDREE